MEKIIAFIFANWRIIAECCAAILALVLYIVRKRPVSDIWTYIFQVCLRAVAEAEKTGYKGSDKMDFALDFVVEAIHQKYPDCNTQRYIALIENTIELILSTPQKKER